MLTASFQANANHEPVVGNQHSLRMQTQRRGRSGS